MLFGFMVPNIARSTLKRIKPPCIMSTIPSTKNKLMMLKLLQLGVSVSPFELHPCQMLMAHPPKPKQRAIAGKLRQILALFILWSN